MKFDSLAMIETNGLVSALVAVNKMISLGNVEFLKKEIIPNGQVTVFIKGGSSEIKRVLNDGIIAAQNAGVVISSGIVPYPNDVIEKIIFESTISSVMSKKVKKSIIEEEKIDSLFDQLDEEKSFVDLMAEVAKNNAGEILSIKHHEPNLGIVEDSTFNIVSSADDDNDDLETPSITSEQTLEPITELLEDEKNKKESIEKIKDSNDDYVTEDDTNEVDTKTEIIEIEETDTEIEDTLEDTSDEKVEFEGMSHLERLRAEAKSEIQSETDSEQSIIEPNENKTEVNKVSDQHLSSEEISETEIENEEVVDNVLSKMNVPDLRKLARSREDFPIKGRE
ncbi:MAG: BMC domain-containing protein, partial [Melioribacteraceae bacterium]|nr:BMC domain-containing protein [Melioribacteraceae bacterium]